MADVFISYSRKDTDFVRRLHAALTARGRDTWIDWEDIPPTADWWKEIAGAIEATDSFIFIISPDSVRSEVCRREVDYAVANNKRLVPILHRPIDDVADQKTMHPSVSTHNWLFFRDSDDFDKSFEALLRALDTDLSHVRQHTRLLVRAKEWEDGHNPSFLLQGDDLKTAETWLAAGVAKKPAPTPLHAAYITASREVATRRQRGLLAGVSVALVVAVGLALLSFLLYGEANVQRGIAEEKSVTATIAQGQAQIEADNAQTQAAIAQREADSNATAQAVAQQEADNAATQAAIAIIAQGEAESQRATADANAVIAQNNAATATFAQGDAEQRGTAVAEERNRAQSIGLSGQAQLEVVNGFGDRGVLMVLYALKNFPPTWQAEQALALAIQNSLTRLEIQGGDAFTSLEFSPDSTRLVTGNADGNVRIWEVATGNELHKLSGHTASINRVLWSPDGSRVASVSDDGTARLWDVETGRELFRLSGHSGAVNSVDWSPDGSSLVTGGDDHTARIWDARTGDLAAVLDDHVEAVTSVDWNTDGLIATGSDDASVKIWVGELSASSQDVGALLHTLSGHTAGINRVLWSPDGNSLLSVSDDDTAKLWARTASNLYAEKADLFGHVNSVVDAGWSPRSSRIVTASQDDTVKGWGGRSGVQQFTLYGHTNDVTGVEWSPDGRRIVTISDDGTARIWDADSRSVLVTLTGHRGSITAVDWSPDGSWIATAGTDRTTRLWQVWRDIPDLIAIAENCCITRPLTDEESAQFGLPASTSAPPPETILSCPDTLPSRLYPGVRAQVTDDDDLALNVRLDPRRTGQAIGQIAPRKTFWVMGEPTCADGVAWFPIIFGINATHGWIAEGADGNYFARPMSSLPG